MHRVFHSDWLPDVREDEEEEDGPRDGFPGGP